MGSKRIFKEDFYIGADDDKSVEKEIMIDVRIIPMDETGQRVESFDDTWREKQFGVTVNIDEFDQEFFAFRTRASYDILKGEYVIKRFLIKEWKDAPAWETQKHEDELQQNLDAFPLFFIDAQRDIIQDLRERTSYFGRLIRKINLKDQALINEIEDQIKTINETIVNNSDELSFLKTELEKLKDTIASGVIVELTPLHKKLRDLGRDININLQDVSSESFPLDYHGMGTRSWASLLTYGAFISWQYKNLSADNKPYHTLLALEEPEAHLHPQAQRTLYRQLSQMKGEKIISTHSPFIAAQCELDEIRHFNKSSSFTEVRALDMTNWTDEDKRKLRREVLNTRGELLFAKAVVLIEGETEEQAFPIFAEKYWRKHPYELGISFVGIGGEANYTPFLRLLNAFKISWFIFSDGEENAKARVNKSLEEIGLTTSVTQDNIKIIPNEMNIEAYLVSLGYQSQIKNAIFKFKEINDEIENENELHRAAKEREVQAMSDEDLRKYMKAYKKN